MGRLVIRQPWRDYDDEGKTDDACQHDQKKYVGLAPQAVWQPPAGGVAPLHQPNQNGPLSLIERYRLIWQAGEMRVRDRDVGRILRAPLQGRHWRGLARATTTYRSPGTALCRYLSNGGAYPWRPRLRTPLGEVRPELHSYHDLLTIQEVFCRRDYGDAADYKLVVDIGANVGLATLFFLTRNAQCRAVCFEPDPANVERLRVTLDGFEERYELIQKAVTAADTDAVFFVASGRYGHIANSEEDAADLLTLPAIGIERALASVMAGAGIIDLVKIDTEGSEALLVSTLTRSVHAPHIKAVVYEDNAGHTRWL